MATQMLNALNELCQIHHIDEFLLLDRLEQSLAHAYEDMLHLEDGARVTIDRMTGKVYVYKLIPKGDPDPETGEYGDFDEEDVTPKDTSRIAAIYAKQEIAALVREAEKKQIYAEFSDRVGDVINGIVLQSTPDFTIIKIRDGVEAELPHFNLKRYPDERNERPAGEHYLHNQRLKAIIIDVRDTNNPEKTIRNERFRPTLVVSRSHPELLRRLFELEVPEIYDGIVEINSVAREPGYRSKIAVSSHDSHLDPVGACVGPRGSRVRAVVNELRGERVDVIPWSDDPAVRIAAALSPAQVSQVLVDEDENHVTVIVPDDQLSLAIGKEGQNARLAARLTGYHIDIKNETLAHDIIETIKAQKAEDEPEEEIEVRCAYVSPKGIQCRNLARPGSRYCGVHAKLEEEAEEAALDSELSGEDFSETGEFAQHEEKIETQKGDAE